MAEPNNDDTPDEPLAPSVMSLTQVELELEELWPRHVADPQNPEAKKWGERTMALQERRMTLLGPDDPIIDTARQTPPVAPGAPTGDPAPTPLPNPPAGDPDDPAQPTATVEEIEQQLGELWHEQSQLQPSDSRQQGFAVKRLRLEEKRQELLGTKAVEF